MRQIFAVLSVLAIVGVLAAVTFAGAGSPETRTAAPVSAASPTPLSYTDTGFPIPPPAPPAVQGYPGPTHTPYGGVLPTVLGHPMPTPIHVTGPAVFPTDTPLAAVTSTPIPPTPTWGPLPTILPTVVPANLPRPRGYPTGIPRLGTGTMSEADSWPMAQQVDAMTYVIRARVARIDPPFWSTDDGKRPAILSFLDVASPALLNVEEVFKGPAISTLEVAVHGYCFTPTECTGFVSNYTWSDVVGYDLILFVVQQLQDPSQPIVPTRTYPFRTYIVNPDSTKDEVIRIYYNEPISQSLSQLESEIRAAPSANH